MSPKIAPNMAVSSLTYDRFRWQKDTTNRRAKGQRAGDKSRTQQLLIPLEQKGVDLIDIINFLFQTVPHDPVPFGAVGEGIACAFEQVDGFIFGQVQPNRKGQHRFLFGVVVAIALNFGEMLPGDVGLLVHGGVFQPPLINEPQQSGGEALAKVVHQAFQTAGCPGCRGGCRNCT